jgi:hypothetical protein
MQRERELKGNLHLSKTSPKMLNESGPRGNGLKWSEKLPLQNYLQHPKMQKNMQKHCQNNVILFYVLVVVTNQEKQNSE